MAAAKRGDSEAFEVLVRSTYADVYGLALRLVGNEHDAADVLQEAYLRAFKSLRRFRGEASFSTWMYRITANCSSTMLSKRKRADHLEIEEGLEVVDVRPERDPEASVDTAHDREQLVSALRELPENLRMVVVLRDVYDMPHEAIAAELGISQTAAKVRLHRARRRLREQLFASAPAGVHEPASATSEGRGEVTVLPELRRDETHARAV